MKCKNCLHYKNEWCEQVADSPYSDIERECRYYSHMTNADKIRKMSDKELEEFLWGFDFEEIARESEYMLSRRQIEKWLKQLVEDN